MSDPKPALEGSTHEACPMCVYDLSDETRRTWERDYSAVCEAPRADAECDYCWRLGLLVARNVTVPTGQGARSDTFSTEKVSGNAFANRSGTSAKRVSRYFDARGRTKAADDE